MLVLNILSHGTILLLKEITSDVFEVVRWGLATSRNGIPTSSFLSLGRATSLFGVFNLFAGKENESLVSRDGNRIWSLQRYPLYLY